MAFSKITIIGAGNVAHHLALQLVKMQLPLQEIAGRPSAALRALAKKCKVQAQEDFDNITVHRGLYILAVSDDAIGQLAKRLPPAIVHKANVVHCSGATPSTLLKKSCAKFGVFWPIQTFSKTRKVNFKGLPFLITTTTPALEKNLKRLAKDLGSISQVVNDKDRLRYHAAAVIVNNFSNHLYAEAQQFLKQQKLPFEVLHPLLLETAKKAIDIGPAAAQTGPAQRGDERTMQQHLQLMKKDKGLLEIYRQLSERIAK